MNAGAIVLASRSPRRSQLLEQIGIEHAVLVTDVDESLRPAELAEDYVLRLAREKAAQGYRIAAAAPRVVIGADTTVVVDDEILGKPCGPKEGKAMLRLLSGRAHTVLTGVAAFNGARIESSLSASRVWFKSMTEPEIEAYWATGEGADKAGSYGIQGFGGIFVERIEGSFSGIMGLPVAETEALLQALDIDTWSMRTRWLKNSS